MEMNAHLAQSEATATELEEIAAVPFQIVTPRHGKPVIGVVQDALAGSYRLTRPGITFNRREFMNLMMYNKQFDGTLPTPKAELARYTGQQVMSQLLPPINMSMGNKSYDDKDTQESPNYVKIRQGEILQGTLDDDIFGKAGKGIIHTTYNDYGPKQTVELLDAIQSTVESFLVLNGFSVGISDLVADETTKAEVEKIIAQKKKEVEQIMLQVHLGLFDNNTGKTNQQEFEDQIFKILNEATNSAGGMATKSLSSENRLISMIKAGSKGNKTNIAQMVACLGQQAIEGKRITYGFTDRTLPHYKKYDDSAESRGFIESSFIRGLSPQEFFFHAMSGREGLIDTAVKSVTGDTRLVIIENNVPKYTTIGEWIDKQLDSVPMENIEHYTDRNMELLRLPSNHTFIPTADENGVVSWGEVTAITRHDPGTAIYEVKTLGGRTAKVTESQSLLVWNEVHKKFLRKSSPEVVLGDYLPVTETLEEPPVILDRIDVSKYLSKTKYVFGTDFCVAKDKMELEMNNRQKIPAGWWQEKNGREFTLPYPSKARFQRTMTRSNTSHIKPGYVYPYSAKRCDIAVPESFMLDYDNGLMCGLFLSEGNLDIQSGYIQITNNNTNIQTFVQNWFTSYKINSILTVNKNKIGGTTSDVRGFSTIMAKLFDVLMGHGAENKYIPIESYCAPDEFIRGVISGYISGDGTISKNSIEVSSASEKLIEGVSMLLSRLGIFGKVFKTQLKSNNLNTQNIKPTYRLSVRGQWASIFKQKIELIDNNKQAQLKALSPSKTHRNFPVHNNCVLDRIVEINVLGVDKYPKVYDLTIPSTLNFGLANGLHVVDTAETGYIQRQLIKALEDLVTQHDGTVRDAAGNIVQFHYGEDGTAATKIESQSLPFLKFSQGDIRKTFGLEAVDWSLIMEEGLGVPSINQELVSAFVERAIEDQRILVEYVGKSSNLDVGAVQAPVNVSRCIMNTKIQFGLTPDGRTDLVPDVVLTGIERIIQRTAPYNRIWTALVRFYLAPHNIILKERFTRRAFDTLAETLVVRHMKSWAQPGEQVGIIAAQSIGEPATQMTLNSVDWDEKIMIACDGKIVCPRIGEFVDNYIKDNVNRVKTFPNNQLYVEMDQDHNWQAVSCDQSGIMHWTRLEAVTKHPVVNADGTDTILEVELECGRKVKATKGKSFLTVQDGKLVATNGSELQVGDSLPLATTLATDFLPKVAVFDLKTILPPTKWIYGDEVERALAVMKAADIAGQRHWFSANNGTGAFTVPYSRSDGFRDAFVNGHNSRAVSGYFRAECVYPKSTRSSTSHIPAVLPLDREFGYLAGAYLAEGSSSTTHIQITNNDVEYLAPIEILLHKWSVGYHITKEVREIENTGIQGLTQSLVIHSTLLTEILTQLFGKKSYSKTFPDWVFQAPDEFVKGLVDGYIGGDGCVSSNSLSFGSVSEDLIVRMGTLLARYGLVGRISNYMPELRRFKSVSRFYKYTLTVFDSFKFAEIFTLTLKRKQERLDEILERGFRRFPNREVLGDVWLSKIKTISEVRPLRGEVYDLTVAETRNFLLLNTIACRDTFHLAGVASKSNVTRGVPRLRELLKVTKNPKATSLVIPLKPELRDNKDRAREVQQDLELTTLKMITNKAAIFWEPTEENVNEDDKEWVRFNRLIEASLAGDGGKEAEDAETEDGATESKSDAAQTNTNKWVIRLELNREIMFNKNISIQDVVFAINNSNQDNLQVSYTDYNADKLVIRIEEDKNLNSDYVGLKKFLNSLLITTVIRGIPGIKAVTFRKDNQILELKNMVVATAAAASNTTADKKYEVVEQYILDTDGSNYIAVMNHPLVDGRRLTSTNVHDIYEVLGIEATRETLMIEINSLFNEVGVNYRHLGLLTDVMTRAGRLMSADRYGINKNDIGPLAKMSFEETEKIVQKASVFGEVDPVTGVSANIMMGQVIRGGTAYSQILLDEQALARLSEGLPPVPVDEEEQDGDISDLIENAVAITDPCSTTQFQVHLQIPAAANIIEEPDVELEVV